MSRLVARAVDRMRGLMHASGSPYWHVKRGADIALDLDGYLAGKRHGRQMIAALAPEEAERVAELASVGFAGLDGLPDAALARELAQEVDGRLERMTSMPPPSGGAAKNFWNRMVGLDDHVAGSAFIRYALQPFLVRMASAYLGSFPLLADVQVFVSHHVPGQEWRESQLWHRDHDDKRMVKLVVYLSDCLDEGYGPFSVVERRLSLKVKQGIFPTRVTDAKLKHFIGDNGITRILLPATGAFVVDTAACYHSGSRVAAGKRRVAYIATFTTRFRLYPDLTRMPDFLAASVAR